jgi:hypothetical protein
MALSRYTFARQLPGAVSISAASHRIHRAVLAGTIVTQTIVLEEGRRLDQVAGDAYGDASYWWVIAAASGIGWGLQVPAGTLIRVPSSLEEVIGELI